MPYETIKSEGYLTAEEIAKNLEKVEYIIMAAPSVRDDAKAPLHITLFLNTPDNLPSDIQKAVLDKFAEEYTLRDISDLFAQPDRVAFAKTAHDTPVPMHLFKAEEKKQFPSTRMFIMDFEADSELFPEVKEQQLTGWSYIFE